MIKSDWYFVIFLITVIQVNNLPAFSGCGFFVSLPQIN